jgi:hypothetical protein
VDVSTGLLLALKHFRLGGNREAVDAVKAEARVMAKCGTSPRESTASALAGCAAEAHVAVAELECFSRAGHALLLLTGRLSECGYASSSHTQLSAETLSAVAAVPPWGRCHTGRVIEWQGSEKLAV